MKTMRIATWPLLACALLCVAPAATAFYNPQTGRWLNRDPLGEPKGANLFTFSGNEAIAKLDYLGLKWVFAGPPIGTVWIDDGTWPPPPPERPPVPANYRRDCCDEDVISAGYDELVRRFNLGIAYLDGLGIVRDPTMKAPKSLSCAEAARRFITFMQPAPPCWICYWDRRREPLYQYIIGLPHQLDENVVACYPIRKDGSTGARVVFDWFGAASKPGYDYGEYQTQYPKHLEFHPPPKSCDCREFYRGQRPWVPRFDNLWTDININDE